METTTQTRSPIGAASIFVVLTAVAMWWIFLIDGVGALMVPEYTRGAHIVRALGATLFAVPLIALALRYPVRRSWADIGLERAGAGLRQFAAGAGYWLVPAATVLAVAVAAGWTEITVRASAVETAGVLLGLTVLVLLYEAIPEELVFRGFLYTALAGRWSPAWSVCGQAVLFTVFGVVIGAAASSDRIVLFVVFAALLGALRAVTGSLWTCMGFHTAFQVTAQLLVGDHWSQAELADPDGTISALAFVAVPFLITAALLWWRNSRARRGTGART
ncbi:CPBP family intramembrane metalloprotease [Nocardia flavorosea]|uniref:CPBP family intramembrane glutamic endopeptidase n=1 Tax=Nocardia flavorosea TaxID=53429 RepID=UPI0018956424|nr:CPBP family intramembrane glutamic endopeptidase [Nocardia flavorosea]MBF6351278.1 CPBP family intramembrane metalloprotease [Nocardia flavorosea]